VTSIEDARVATGWSGSGAERLTGRGDFLAVAEGRVIRFQAAHVTPAEIRQVLADQFYVSPHAIAPPPAAAVTIPEPEPVEPDPTAELARFLMKSPLWADRKNGDDYRWGWWSRACELLFDQPYAGAFANKTKAIVYLAEEFEEAGI